MHQSLSQQRWTRRHALWLLTGAIAGGGLHACTQASSQSGGIKPENLVQATLGVPTWIGLTPMLVALEKQFFQKRGLDLRLRTFSTMADAFPAFSTGQIEAAAPVTAEAVLLASQGADFRIVLVEDTSAGADAVLARNSITDIADFKGKRIAVQKGGVGHYFVMQVLAEAGLSEKDVTIVDATLETTAAAYEAGNVDIAYLYSPYLEKAAAAQPDGRIIYDSSKMPTAIADVYAFNSEFIKTNPEAVQAFVDGVLEGLDLVKNKPNEVLPIAAKQIDLSSEDLKKQLNGIRLIDLQTNLEMLANPQSDVYLPKRLNTIAKFLKDQGQIATLPDLSNLIDPQFIQAARRNT